MTQMRNAVFVDGCRIPFLRAGTEYKQQTSYDLGRMAIKALLDRSQIAPDKINWVLMGSVISNLATSNVAREAALA
ncbi:MAG: acetyl-CoA C-acyltransferase, partial [Calditrichota bacterium]